MPYNISQYRLSAEHSKLRQQISRSFKSLARTLGQLLRSEPMVPGSLYQLRRKCGKPNCRCAGGELHARWVLTRSEQGKKRLYSVSDEERGRLRDLTAGYRRYQRARAAWVKATAALLAKIDSLAEKRILSWPKENQQNTPIDESGLHRTSPSEGSGSLPAG